MLVYLADGDDGNDGTGGGIPQVQLLVVHDSQHRLWHWLYERSQTEWRRLGLDFSCQSFSFDHNKNEVYIIQGINLAGGMFLGRHLTDSHYN